MRDILTRRHIVQPNVIRPSNHLLRKKRSNSVINEFLAHKTGWGRKEPGTPPNRSTLFDENCFPCRKQKKSSYSFLSVFLSLLTGENYICIILTFNQGSLHCTRTHTQSREENRKTDKLKKFPFSFPLQFVGFLG